ncbi:hypothetical protein AVEN_55325-1 [Araneus ventricosus]|uniref:Uncharacterized protein n=1 Tax=Araneus ventricosus TaxID=182803 RepID=A0A4Y2DE24_ARAVE|nr:hypothetical protein AVEN_55325-1 [Araneus ventricosus]
MNSDGLLWTNNDLRFVMLQESDHSLAFNERLVAGNLFQAQQITLKLLISLLHGNLSFPVLKDFRLRRIAALAFIYSRSIMHEQLELSEDKMGVTYIYKLYIGLKRSKDIQF